MSALTLTPGNALIRVEAARILMALPFRAYQDVRYYFNGVCIQPATDGGANILATDGYAMACIRDIGGRCGGPAILPIGKAQKPQLRKGGHVLLDPSGVCYITDAQDEPIWIAPTGVIDGKFPDLTSILHPLDEYAGAWSASSTRSCSTVFVSAVPPSAGPPECSSSTGRRVETPARFAVWAKMASSSSWACAPIPMLRRCSVQCRPTIGCLSRPKSPRRCRHESPLPAPGRTPLHAADSARGQRAPT